MNIALLSPNKHSYSETFIQAQKEGLDGKVYYYYGADMPTYLECYGNLLSIPKLLYFRFKRLLGLTTLEVNELAMITSLRKQNIEVVLAQYGPTGTKIMAVCAFLKIPLVVHFHGYDASKNDVIKSYGMAYKAMFQYASYIIVVSRAMEDDLQRLGCPKAKIVYNPCAPNLKFHKIRPNFNKPQFLAVGRFTEKKGPLFTIKSFYDVVKIHPQARLIMAGDGALMTDCKLLVKQLKLENHVSFPGIIKQGVFVDYLQESLAFVQHSIIATSGDKEGTPVAVMEASLSGLPVISTYHGGIPDVIINGKTGLLVEEQDIVGMTKCMLRLLNDTNYAKLLGLNGKNYIHENMSFDQHINKLNSIILKTINYK